MHRCTDQSVGRLLHAYELGLLSGPELEKFEVHLLECPECAGEAADGASAMQLVRSGSEVRRATGHAVLEPGLHPTTLNPLRSIWSALGGRQLRWAAALVIFILLCYPVYRLVMGPPSGPVARTEVLTLIPTRSQTVPELHKAAGRYATVIFLFRPAEPSVPYQLTIADSLGRVVFEDSSFTGFSDFRTANLILDLRQFSKGEYVLTITDGRSGAPGARQDYQFEVVD